MVLCLSRWRQEGKEALHGLPNKRYMKSKLLFAVALCTPPVLPFVLLSWTEFRVPLGYGKPAWFYKGNGKMVNRNVQWGKRDFKKLPVIFGVGPFFFFFTKGIESILWLLCFPHKQDHVLKMIEVPKNKNRAISNFTRLLWLPEVEPAKVLKGVKMGPDHEGNIGFLSQLQLFLRPKVTCELWLQTLGKYRSVNFLWFLPVDMKVG